MSVFETNWAEFNNDIPAPMPVKYVQSASKLTDDELMRSLVSRGLLAEVYCEQVIPLKDTMFSPQEREQIMQARKSEMAQHIGFKMLHNGVIGDECIAHSVTATHQQTLRMSAYVLTAKVKK
jgi:hypothetical protein